MKSPTTTEKGLIAGSRTHRMRRLTLGLCCLVAMGCSSGPDESVTGDVLAVDVQAGDSTLGEGVGNDVADAVSGDVVATTDGVASGDGGGTDATSLDAGPCAGAVGCPCAANGDCDSDLCVGEGDGAVCGTDCKAGCDDSNPCTVDLCEPATVTGTEPSCAHSAAADGGTCDDGNPCTGAGTCAAGFCGGGQGKDCDDKETCTTDYCDKSGLCQHTPLTGKPCDDDDTCTVGDACAAGACAAGKAQQCDDSNPCTDDSCDPKTGCVSKDAVGKGCDDGDACTGGAAAGDTCTSGACTPGASKNCDDGDPCTVDGCASDKGCSHGSQAGAPCSDGDVCTVGDVCGAKGCTGGEAQPCDDGNPCTDNSCDKVAGCVATNNTATCTDGSACTSGDACEGGVCLPGALTNCDDNNPCTSDACDPGAAGVAGVQGATKGGCVNKAADGGACVPQGDSCAVTGICAAKACKKVAVKGCDDGDPCSTDACDTASGKCVYKPGKVGISCDDGNVCTSKDVCAAGGCEGAARTCDDGNACTIDACDPTVTKGCVNKASAGLSCNDGDLCTANDVCKGGSCTAGGQLACDDGNPCSDDSCDAKAGCVNKVNTKPCDDNNGCTTGDKCGVGVGGVAVCTPGAAKGCDDGKHCTKDICDPKASGGAGGCVSSPDNGLGCDDGDVCTEGDVCKSGVCVSGPAQLCNDDNVCTLDKCDAKKGCVTSPTPGKCTDGDVCTVGDTCEAGKCAPGKVTVCDDNKACTSDSCHYLKGCVYAALTGACNDGDACTTGDACKNGVCLGTKPTMCDDKNVCTNDSCDKLKGCLVVPNSNPCDDNNVCSIGDKCTGGTCKAGLTVKKCSDGKICTADTCDKVKGCLFPANTAECTDSDACTKNDQCDQFKCVSGPKLSCDDQNLCTDDSCSVATGCVHKKNSHPAFKVITDNTTSDSGLWLLSASNNKVKWSFKGSYYEMLGALYSTQRMTLKPVLDLSCAVAPTLYYEERFHGAPLSVEVSLDGTVWTVVRSGVGGSDYVWRERVVDLSGYIGKKVVLRFRTAPSNSTYWSNLRRIELREKRPALKLVTWGTKLGCADIVAEGPLFKCVADGAGYQLQTVGTTMTPPAYMHSNLARFNVRFDRSKVKSPRLMFEERHKYGSLAVWIRQAGKVKWQAVWQRPGNTIDYVWRRHRVDLGSVPGDVWEVAIATHYSNKDFWLDLRNVSFTTTPADVSPLKAPYKWTQCKGLDVEGDALTCGTTGKPYDIRWETGSAGTKPTYDQWHRVTSLRRVDLSGLSKPIVRYYRRYYRGRETLEASLDGVQWTSHTYTNYGTSDYVWREQVADLSLYKGKVIWLRLAINPIYSSNVWGEIKGLEVADAPKAWPVVKWGPQTFSCGQWGFETKGWSCDDKTGLKLIGNADTPSSNAYQQYAELRRTFDLTGVKNAAVRFEQLSRNGQLWFQVRKSGGDWWTVWSRNNALDPIFRHVEVDLSTYAGQKIELRFFGRPYYPPTQPQALKIRNFTLGTKVTLPTVKFGAPLPCKLWRQEGSGFTCDPTAKKWTWRLKVATNDVVKYWHQTELMAWIDLANTVDPQVYFERAVVGNPYFYFQVTTDGSKWVNLNTIYSLLASPFGKRQRFDLSNYVGKKIRIRMRGQPHSYTYVMELDKFSWRERDKVAVIKAGTKLASKDMLAEGSWTYDSKDSTWKVDATYLNYYQTLLINKAFDLSQSIHPELRFESLAKHSFNYVDVSTDGVQWSNVWLRSTSNAMLPDFEPTVVNLTAWAGQKQVFVRFRQYSYAPASYIPSWWVRGITVGEHVSLAVVKAPLSLTAAHLKVTGQWKLDSKTGVYSLNQPTSSAIDSTIIGYHQLWPKVRIDLSGLTSPELTYTTRVYGAIVRFDVSTNEGLTWQQAPITGTPQSVVWRYMSVDLAAFAGQKSVLIRPSARPGNKAYWAQLKDLRVANRYVFPSVAADSVPANSKWKLETGWVTNSKDGSIERVTDALNQYSYAFLQVTFNLKTVKKPRLRFEESGLGVTRYVEVSDDGIIWQILTVPGGATSKWIAKNLDLSAFGGSPTVYVRIRGHISSNKYAWRVRKLTISKK